MQRLITLTILFISIITFQAFGNSSYIVNTGHSSPVQTFTTNGTTLYSSDNNGTLMLWDSGSGRLLKKIKISNMMIKEIAVNSDGSRIAIIETDTISSFKLSVWDLKDNSKIFSHKIDELPLFIKYSPTDKYILYSKTDWNGLRFIDAEKGFEVPFINDDYGIVASIFITRSEKTLLFYSPSGSIQYWNLTTGKIKTAPIRTRKDLSSISITDNGAYMTASDSSNLYLINLQTGKTLYSVEMGGVIDSFIENKDNKLFVLFKDDLNFFVKSWSMKLYQGKGILVEDKLFKIPFEIVPPAGFTKINNTIFLAGTRGEIISLNVNNGKTALFSDNIVPEISDLHFLDDELLIATKENIISIRSRMFSDKGETETISDLNVKTYLNPFGENTGITSNSSNFFIYPMEKSKGVLKILKYGHFGNFSDSFTSPIISAEFSGESFITLEKDGTCQEIDSATGNSKFSYTSYGINSVESVYGNNLIAGRNRSAFLNSPLLHINKSTEEVVPINESNILIFKMDYDPVKRTLYTLGFEKRNNGLLTVLKSHTGRAWELTETLFTYPGEDQAGSFIVDSKKSRIYLSIGDSGMIMYGWDGYTPMDIAPHIPEKLYVHNDFLVALNTDNTISVWNTTKGELLFDFYLLNNSQWIVNPQNGEAIFSTPSLRHLVN